ncbi:hypothetical protein CC1G_05907 [Coprinopsis cinerea okayama7|uniref:Uncharacterized protein n=1 Tax=Coprinopsis cinerea (strain Okayama-7 / 130 / ATCC MYA-4618 / FGSC 9003) TaxID=240176 RepID=A8NAF6_COPC7|nr:hypothetical protein CC1G_05907 [Coprinopsis cinerea okayama7\|eukprot:XP_001831808.2 hypothetical protein CC1G_05907 [Coprinopsis cinerea okayama7\
MESVGQILRLLKKWNASSNTRSECPSTLPLLYFNRDLSRDSSWVLVDNDDPVFQYEGEWETNPEGVEAINRESIRAGPVFNYTSRWTRSGGSVSVTFQVDGQPVPSIAPSFGLLNNQILCDSGRVLHEWHTLTLNVTGRGDPLWVDFFRYTPTPIPFLDPPLTWFTNDTLTNQFFFKTPQLPHESHRLRVVYHGNSSSVPLALDHFIYEANGNTTGSEWDKLFPTDGGSQDQAPPARRALSAAQIGGIVGGVVAAAAIIFLLLAFTTACLAHELRARVSLGYYISSQWGDLPDLGSQSGGVGQCLTQEMDERYLPLNAMMYFASDAWACSLPGKTSDNTISPNTRQTRSQIPQQLSGEATEL